jgi:hypothetical protein
MRPIEIFQGDDEVITVETGLTDLTTASEIEFAIDAYPQIVKTLTGGHISDVSTSQFLVAIDAADTASVTAGNYKYQCQATVAGKISHGRFTPNKIIIRNSVFTDEGSGRDYS